MSSTETPTPPSVPEPLPENLRSVQPGGGVCYRIELAWGAWRRWYLKWLRPGYVRRMAALRHGDPAGAPHEILDPRDLKFCRNVCSAEWDSKDDPFLWRGRIPFARWGLAELQLMGWPLLCLTAFFAYYFWIAALPFGVLAALVIWFFRDPPRRIPEGAELMVSPADGKISEITRLERDEFIGGPAVRIGIFLSIFNVHLNRSPAAARVIGLKYFPGKFLNAMKPESARENESMWIGLEEQTPPHRRMVVRQIAGAYARRIVCALRPGDSVGRGDKMGMIKLGSRTELILADKPGLRIEVRVGDRIKAGASVLARYEVKTARPDDGA
jgi:phosphatidylserine decarboxylase